MECREAEREEEVEHRGGERWGSGIKEKNGVTWKRKVEDTRVTTPGENHIYLSDFFFLYISYTARRVFLLAEKIEVRWVIVHCMKQPLEWWNPLVHGYGLRVKNVNVTAT